MGDLQLHAASQFSNISCLVGMGDVPIATAFVVLWGNLECMPSSCLQGDDPELQGKFSIFQWHIWGRDVPGDSSQIVVPADPAHIVRSHRGPGAICSLDPPWGAMDHEMDHACWDTLEFIGISWDYHWIPLVWHVGFLGFGHGAYDCICVDWCRLTHDDSCNIWLSLYPDCVWTNKNFHPRLLIFLNLSNIMEYFRILWNIMDIFWLLQNIVIICLWYYMIVFRNVFKIF